MRQLERIEKRKQNEESSLEKIKNSLPLKLGILNSQVIFFLKEREKRKKKVFF